MMLEPLEWAAVVVDGVGVLVMGHGELDSRSRAPHA